MFKNALHQSVSRLTNFEISGLRKGDMNVGWRQNLGRSP